MTERSARAPGQHLHLYCRQVWCEGKVHVTLDPGPGGEERLRWVAHALSWPLDCPECGARRAADPAAPLAPPERGLPVYLASLVGAGKDDLAEEQLRLLAESNPKRAEQALEDLCGPRWGCLRPASRRRWVRLALELLRRRAA